MIRTISRYATLRYATLHRFEAVFSGWIRALIFACLPFLFSTNILQGPVYNSQSKRLQDLAYLLSFRARASRLSQNRFYFVTSFHLLMHSPMISVSRFLWGEFLLQRLSISKIASSLNFIRESISGGVFSARFTSRVWLMTFVRVAECRLQGQIVFSYKSPLSSLQYTALVADLLF